MIKKVFNFTIFTLNLKILRQQLHFTVYTDAVWQIS